MKKKKIGQLVEENWRSHLTTAAAATKTTTTTTVKKEINEFKFPFNEVLIISNVFSLENKEGFLLWSGVNLIKWNWIY